MLFPTFTFAAFFAVVLCGGWTLHRRDRAWKLFMLVASYVFYGWVTWWWILLLAASTAMNLAFARLNRAASREPVRRLWVGLAVAGNLTLLGVFKYLDFGIDAVYDALDSVGLHPTRPLLDVVLPVGISFYTFQAISYIVDVHRKVIEPARPLDFAVYLAFFPQLVAGPIVRASEFLPQLNRRRDPHDIELTRAMVLIGAGLFKKVVISSYMADAIVDDVFAFPERFSAIEIIVAVYAYAIQIYADFSGYTDIAIGIALLLGFRFPDNFDQPYRATSIQDFWRRWHMTLSRWLRDYLYISLGGNRRGIRIRNRNLFLTMLLGGLWHGAAWTFVIWGAFHGGGLVLERRALETKDPRRHAERARIDSRAGQHHPRDGRVAVAQRSTDRTDHKWAVLRWTVTFHFVCIGWVFFRAPSVDTALSMLGRTLTAWSTDVAALSLLLVATIAGALAAQFASRTTLARLRDRLSHISIGAQATLFGIWLVIVDVLGPEGVAPFIYFQF